NGNVQVYQQEKNMGVSMARNLGITNAKGDYILFLDSDDFVDTTYFDVLDRYTEKKYDLISFGHYDYRVNGDIIKVEKSDLNCSGKYIENREEKVKQLLLVSFFASPCNKVYKREIICKNNIRFDKDCVCFEDYLFNLEYCRYIESFILTDTPIYYYRQLEQCNAASKRRWGETFEVSRKVAKGTNIFIKESPLQVDVRYLRRYTYKAFMTELEYVYLNRKSEWKQCIEEVVSDNEFDKAVDAIVPSGKKLFLYRLFSKFNLKPLKLILLNKMICEVVQEK
ncbi:glycosyltransferase family 2 protein, partial [Eubacterium ventriosum]|uniref:glycosyltransferase family 2 protein n=1 Tax=Eubacterium ventriosum TaxID=39496 RepID=UPI003AB291B7